MKLKTILTGTTLALAGWFAVASASTSAGLTARGPEAPAAYQLAQDEDHGMRRDQRQWEHREGDRDDERDNEWYQGQRGHWDRDHDNWIWRGAQGDEWYQGQPGHWYQEQNGWQFGSTGLICDNQGRNCRRGGYLPRNGEGMVSRGNPRMFWHCDSDGHKCRWAPRPGY